jgi:hypothetical protein
MTGTSIEFLAAALFGLAVLHTFCVRRFAHWACAHPPGSLRRNTLHFLAETELVFGLWAAVLLAGIAWLKGSFQAAASFLAGLDFTGPLFVFVIMIIAATRPVVRLAETLIARAARMFPVEEGLAFYFTALSLGPLLGSFITEPAAMTLLALALKRRYFDGGISRNLAYASLGLLFVNVSIGGILTPFAAPPVVMVAAKWHWDLAFMVRHFGGRAAAACVVSTALVAAVFQKELRGLKVEPETNGRVPAGLTALHLLFLGLVVAWARHPGVCLGVFVLFLGLVAATHQHQDALKLRAGLLVGIFLAGLVTLGSLQAFWLKPLIQNLSGNALFFGATGLTALADNAALTYLGSLVDGLSESLKYALVAGSVAGGGLTVIANAPNLAGVGILQSAKVFQADGISPLGLFLGALVPTAVAVLCFWCLK